MGGFLYFACQLFKLGGDNSCNSIALSRSNNVITTVLFNTCLSRSQINREIAFGEKIENCIYNLNS